mgnify:CR=1 FL=1
MRVFFRASLGGILDFPAKAKACREDEKGGVRVWPVRGFRGNSLESGQVVRSITRVRKAPDGGAPQEAPRPSVTREQLAEVAVAARAWANLNPAAFARGPLSVADVLASRMISDPLTVLDCCLVTDGGAACVMTRADRARHLASAP